jgi:hypothetical protein
MGWSIWDLCYKCVVTGSLPFDISKAGGLTAAGLIYFKKRFRIVKGRGLESWA